MATYKNLFIDQGSDFNVTIDLSPIVGSLVLTNYTGRGQVRKTYNSSAKTDFLVTLDSVNKELLCNLTSEKTGALKPGRYVYDLEILSPDSPSIVTRVIEGQVEVTPRVTLGA
jgi:hypothetical protein